jgi:predicted aspartyl protease
MDRHNIVALFRGISMRSVSFALCAGALALFAALPAHAEGCKLLRMAALDMGLDVYGRPTVPMTVGGHAVTMLLDTGGIDTLIAESVVHELHLYQERLRSDQRLTAFGGRGINFFATAPDVQFGRLKSARMDFLIMPDDELGEGLGGILAPDILRAYDDDIDFAHARLTLFAPSECGDGVVYWASDYARIEMSLDETAHMQVPVTIDGQEVRMQFDTGAAETVLSLSTAQSLFGLTETSPGMVRGEEGTYDYRFKTLTFGTDAGAVTVTHPKVRLVPEDVSNMHGHVAILGMNVLRQLHLYVSYKQKRLFVTAAGAH